VFGVLGVFGGLWRYFFTKIYGHLYTCPFLQLMTGIVFST